jgi:CPA1 family monovalent cation:H+ antiporter
VIFIIFLPPLLSAAAFFSSPLELRVHLRPILLLAIGLVLCTTAAIALVAHFLIGLPWAAAFVLGAILAPTDRWQPRRFSGGWACPDRWRRW